MSLEFARLAADAASEKTTEETVIFDVADLIAITEYFVVTAGRNERQVRAIVDAVEQRLKADGPGGPRQVEGLGDSSWVLIDYGSFVVHVFDAKAREYYGLERLWADAERVPLDRTLTGVSTDR